MSSSMIIVVHIIHTHKWNQLHGLVWKSYIMKNYFIIWIYVWVGTTLKETAARICKGTYSVNHSTSLGTFGHYLVFNRKKTFVISIKDSITFPVEGIFKIFFVVGVPLCFHSIGSCFIDEHKVYPFLISCHDSLNNRCGDKMWGTEPQKPFFLSDDLQWAFLAPIQHKSFGNRACE